MCWFRMAVFTKLLCSFDDDLNVFDDVWRMMGVAGHHWTLLDAARHCGNWYEKIDKLGACVAVFHSFEMALLGLMIVWGKKGQATGANGDIREGSVNH